MLFKVEIYVKGLKNDLNSQKMYFPISIRGLDGSWFGLDHGSRTKIQTFQIPLHWIPDPADDHFGHLNIRA